METIIIINRFDCNAEEMVASLIERIVEYLGLRAFFVRPDYKLPVVRLSCVLTKEEKEHIVGMANEEKQILLFLMGGELDNGSCLKIAEQ